MTRIRFEDLPSTNTPRNATNLNKLNNVVISSTEPTTGEEVWIDETNKKIYTKSSNTYNEFYDKSNYEIYSTNETRIGTWINNKKVYRKVFEVTPTTTDWNYENHNISNLDKIINCYGYASNSQYTGNRIPLNTYSTGGIDIFVQTSRIAFKSTNSNLINTPWVIVLEYTKTTN